MHKQPVCKPVYSIMHVFACMCIFNDVFLSVTPGSLTQACKGYCNTPLLMFPQVVLVFV